MPRQRLDHETHPLILSSRLTPRNALYSQVTFKSERLCDSGGMTGRNTGKVCYQIAADT